MGHFSGQSSRKILQNVSLPLSSHLGCSGTDSEPRVFVPKKYVLRPGKWTSQKPGAAPEQEKFNGCFGLCCGYREGNKPREGQGLAQGHARVRSSTLARPWTYSLSLPEPRCCRACSCLPTRSLSTSGTLKPFAHLSHPHHSFPLHCVATRTQVLPEMPACAGRGGTGRVRRRLPHWLCGPARLRPARWRSPAHHFHRCRPLPPRPAGDPCPWQRRLRGPWRTVPGAGRVVGRPPAARRTAARASGQRKPVLAGGRRPGGTHCLSAPPAVPGWALCLRPPPCAPRPSAEFRGAPSLGSADQTGRPHRSQLAPSLSLGYAAPGRAQIRSNQEGCCRLGPGCGLALAPRAPRSASPALGRCPRRTTSHRLRGERMRGVTGAREERDWEGPPGVWVVSGRPGTACSWEGQVGGF